MRPLHSLFLATLALFLPVSGWSQQDLLRGSRTIPDNAQQQDLLRFERIERERQQQQQQQQLFDLEVQRRQIQNDQLRNPPPVYAVPPGAGYAPVYPQGYPQGYPQSYPQPSYPQPGYGAPQQQACRAYAPAYDQAGRFLGNLCVQ